MRDFNADDVLFSFELQWKRQSLRQGPGSNLTI